MRCDDLVGELVPHARGELDLLPSTRMDAHLARCARCRGVVTRIEEGIDAARGWEPEVSEEEMARLGALVAVPLERRRIRGLVWIAVAASIVGMVVRGADVPRETSVATATVAATVDEADEPVVVVAPEAGPRPAKRSKIAPGLKAISSADWNGRLRARTPGALEITASRGFAVLSFEGGGGRTLRVHMPDLDVEVVGTQLFVEVVPGRPTTVGVIHGKVDVIRGGVPTRVLAGTMLHADRARPSKIAKSALSSAPFFGDAFLGKHADPSVLEGLASADALARSGRLADAEAELLALRSRAIGPERGHVDLDLVRLIARDPLRARDAARRLDELTRQASGEVAIQAALLRCELLADRCEARRCYEQVGTAEAQRVLSRSRLIYEPCGS